MKICVSCKKKKGLESFSRMKICKDGLRPRCRICEKSYKDEYRKRLNLDGKCISCGTRPHNELTTLCNECSNIGKKRSANRKTECREKGICITCQKEPARIGKRTCARCSDLVSKLGSAKALNITLAEYESWMRGATCLVCSSGEDLNLDHCHTTGRIRGVLCGGCNRALGLLKENSERIRKLADYSDKHNLTH